MPNVICHAGGSFAAATLGLVSCFAFFESYPFCFNVSSVPFLGYADSPSVVAVRSRLLDLLPRRHRSESLPGADKISHPLVPA